MSTRSARSFVPLGALAVLALLSGCTASTSGTTATDSGATASPAAPAKQLTFAAGADLDPALIAQWSDTFGADSDYTASRPDDGKGNWGYTSTTTQCIVSFWQGGLAGLSATGDDSTLSDALLAVRLGVTVEELAPHTSDTAVAASPEGIVEMRAVTGADSTSGVNYVVAARAFGTLKAGVIADVTCPAGQDAKAQFTAMAAKDLTIAFGSK